MTNYQIIILGIIIIGLVNIFFFKWAILSRKEYNEFLSIKRKWEGLPKATRRHLSVIVLLSFLTSCAPSGKYGYAPARITVYKGKIDIQVKEKFKPLPDTTIEAVIIKRF